MTRICALVLMSALSACGGPISPQDAQEWRLATMRAQVNQLQWDTMPVRRSEPLPASRPLFGATLPDLYGR